MNKKWKVGWQVSSGLLFAVIAFLFAWEFLALPCSPEKIPGIYVGSTIGYQGQLYSVAILGATGQYKQINIDHDTGVEVISGTWKYEGKSRIAIHTNQKGFNNGVTNLLVARYLQHLFQPSFDRYQEFSYIKRE